MFANVDWADIGKATIDTLLMLGGSMVLTVILGVPLGVLLYLSGKGRLAANPVLNAALGDAPVSSAIRYFLMALLAGGVWPMTFGFFGRLGKKKA